MTDPAELVRWLLRDSMDLDEAEFVTELASRLRAVGIPVDRLWMGGPRRHPLLVSTAGVWTAEEGAKVLPLPVDQAWRLRSNPGLEELGNGYRRIVLDTVPRGHFGLPESLWSDGYTEVILGLRGLSVPDQGPSVLEGFFLTMATRDPEGLAEAVDLLASIDDVLLAAYQLRRRTQFARVLARTYLGRYPARQVLAGRVRRGDSTTLRAAIAFVDLRGFTALSESEPAEVVFDLLNDYYDAVVGPIEASEGDVLQFMGDGLLAVWPDPEGEGAAACDRALAAMRAGETAVNAANVARLKAQEPLIAYGVALEYGDVSYGNMGASQRLAYTVLGPAVNAAARLEAVGARLGVRPILSAGFARRVSAECRCLGRHPAKGGEVEAWRVAEPPP